MRRHVLSAVQIATEAALKDPRVKARSALSFSIQAASTIQAWSPAHGGDLDLVGLVEELFDQVEGVGSGNMARPEAMLINQAHTLDAISLPRNSRTDMAKSAISACAWLLKAQSQSRATLETLSVVKNPPSVAFARQANIAHGPQQVNNAPQPVTVEASRAREKNFQPNELIEQQDAQMDTRIPQPAVGADKAMATVGEVHGTEHTGR